MSIQERLSEIQDSMQRFEEERDSTQRQRETERNERFAVQLPETRQKQAELLEELRALGVVSMIEEFVGEPILPLMDDNNNYIVRQPTDEELRKTGESGHTRFDKQWVLGYVSDPEMLDDGSADPTLRINLWKYYMVPREIGMKPIAGARIEFNKFKVLKIFGKEQTFNVYMGGYKKEHAELVETAIAKAVYQPEPLIRTE